MVQVVDDQGCFVCGPNNPIGLKLVFRHDEDRSFCSLSIPACFQGWKDVIHGGIVATLLDEVMAKAAHHSGYTAVTADINVQYKKPTPADTPLELTGRVVDRQRRIVFTEGELRLSDGTLLAGASARFFINSDQRTAKTPESPLRTKGAQ